MKKITTNKQKKNTHTQEQTIIQRNDMEYDEKRHHMLKKHG
jgi:hypothetical protein